MKTILVAVDFSAITEKLLDAAAKQATQNTTVYIVHVAAPEPDFVGLGVGPSYVRQDRAETLREEHKLLATYKEKLQLLGVKAEALLISGSTVETLLEEIEKLGADLLIIGRKGHSRFFEVVVGSVCKEVVWKVGIPVFIIPEGAS